MALNMYLDLCHSLRLEVVFWLLYVPKKSNSEVCMGKPWAWTKFERIRGRQYLDETEIES